MELGRFLRKARKLKNLKVRSLAAEIGVKSHSHISRFENGKEIPTIQQAKELERALDLLPGELIKLVGIVRARDLNRPLLYELEQNGVKMELRPVFK